MRELRRSGALPVFALLAGCGEWPVGDENPVSDGPAWCGPATAALGHMCWPDGVADRSGSDHEADMLAFLRERAR